VGGLVDEVVVDFLNSSESNTLGRFSLMARVVMYKDGALTYPR